MEKSIPSIPLAPLLPFGKHDIVMLRDDLDAEIYAALSNLISTGETFTVYYSTATHLKDAVTGEYQPAMAYIGPSDVSYEHIQNFNPEIRERYLEVFSISINNITSASKN